MALLAIALHTDRDIPAIVSKNPIIANRRATDVMAQILDRRPKIFASDCCVLQI